MNAEFHNGGVIIQPKIHTATNKRDWCQWDGQLWGVSGSAARTSPRAGAMRPSTVSSLDWSVFFSLHFAFILILFAFHRRLSRFFYHPCEIWSRVFQSCVFHPCDLVSRFPFPRFQRPLTCMTVKSPFTQLYFTTKFDSKKQNRNRT